jgi:heptaprenyl diphosphate synthase
MEGKKTETAQDSANFSRIKTMVFTALLFATAIVLAVLENMLPPLPIAVPGVKFGLSNIVVMYALFFLGARQAYTIGVLKALFVLITRGLVAGALSFAGGMLSITIMLLLLYLFKDRVSYLIVGVTGAISHNIGQFLVITVLYAGTGIWGYLPVLLISGLVAGLITATLLRTVMPALRRLA